MKNKQKEWQPATKPLQIVKKKKKKVKAFFKCRHP
jgi:hypothetical protein